MKKRLGLRLVLVASPFEGHLNPMLHLAGLLHLSGFEITFIHTVLNSPDPRKHPDYQFISIPDNLPEELTSSEDHMEFLVALNANCKKPFCDRMESLLADARGSVERVVCLLVDAQLYMTKEAAEQLKLPRIVLRTSGAASFNAFAAVRLFREKGYLSVQEDHLRESLVPEMPTLRIKDLPVFKNSNSNSVNKVLTSIINETRASAAVIMNTIEELESAELSKLRSDLSLPVFPIGPLHKVCPYPLTTRLPPDGNCIDWLDQQTHGSVLYASCGSLACMTHEELLETIWGLANSHQLFLFVLRPGSVRGGEMTITSLPPEFVEETKGRGIVVQWAPQIEVLRHPAVGGFWTHCGWNSVLESICEGVPMICSPCFGDQFGNARVITHIWKVGLQLEDRLVRVEIARTIKRLMVGKEGEEMRERARKLKLRVDTCIKEGGSFHTYLNDLVTHILSM